MSSSGEPSSSVPKGRGFWSGRRGNWRGGRRWWGRERAKGNSGREYDGGGVNELQDKTSSLGGQQRKGRYIFYATSLKYLSAPTYNMMCIKVMHS